MESLVLLKQTRLLRDYSVAGALAEVAGLQQNAPELALGYLQEDQRELSKLDMKGRSAWMAEWLMLADTVPRIADTTWST